MKPWIGITDRDLKTGGGGGSRQTGKNQERSFWKRGTAILGVNLFVRIHRTVYLESIYR